MFILCMCVKAQQGTAGKKKKHWSESSCISCQFNLPPFQPQPTLDYTPAATTLISHHKKTSYYCVRLLCATKAALTLLDRE